MLVSNLSVPSPLDDFFHRVDGVSGILSRLDDSGVDKADLLKQIRPKIIVSGLQFGRPLHYFSLRDDRLMARVFLAGPNDGGIHSHEAVDKALLGAQDVPPRVSPCFRRFDDLTASHQPPSF